MAVDLMVSVDTEGLAQSLVHGMTRGDLIQFIKDLDLTVAEWEFTKELHDYFVEEMKKDTEADREDP